jgi:hypothetical protein
MLQPRVWGDLEAGPLGQTSGDTIWTRLGLATGIEICALLVQIDPLRDLTVMPGPNGTDN